MRIPLLAAALCLAALPAAAQGFDQTDRAFLIQDAQGGMYELAIAELAQKKTSRDDVRAYANRLVSDHAVYNQALAELAKSKGVDLPDDMTYQQHVRLNSINLQGSSTADSSFIEEARRINKEDKDDAAQEAARTSDPEMKAFLAKFTAMDAEHQRLADALVK